MDVNDIGPYLLFDRRCEHGLLCDDYCEKCEGEEMAESESQGKNQEQSK